uniref:Uncharacterized protein n=1 Tax=Heterorhabditis bacteriophora TaxID=37862 RepID=A0A1I7WYA2_HETBA
MAAAEAKRASSLADRKRSSIQMKSPIKFITIRCWFLLSYNISNLSSIKIHNGSLSVRNLILYVVKFLLASIQLICNRLPLYHVIQQYKSLFLNNNDLTLKMIYKLSSS